MSSAEDKPAVTPAVPSNTSSGPEDEGNVVLRCSDGEEFAVAVSVAKKCGTSSNMIDDDCVEGGVPLPNVKSPAMSRVLEYLNKKHGAAALAAEEAREFEKAFFEKMTKEALFDVILAANYLDTEELLEAAMFCAGDRIRGKSVPEIREYFSLENDFTPEEEEEITKENPWAFD
ncbi:SKP1-like protein 11 [Dichanthelium oligosanthes]|uniref:SKP1-like protein n=1 Tax=Dichanthelium oligosanthes TaxID=888268 RepID=A0A1E5UJ00_9POAL|nr:SKP1-like protein 11 [Dichanthelium oligosanthes]